MNTLDLPALTNHIESGIATLDRFIELLEQEQALLAQTPVPMEELNAAIEQKREVAADLEAFEATRRAINEASGYTADAAASIALAEQEDCADRWHVFLERTELAHSRNQTTGLAVQTRLDLTQDMIDFLHRNADETLYAANGRKMDQRGRTLRTDV